MRKHGTLDVGLCGNGKFANRANGGSCVKTVLISGAAICVVAVSPAQAQDSIFGKLLKQVSRATGPTTAGAAGQPLLRPSATVQPTAEQTASLRAALLVKQPNTQIAQDVRDANALIERLAQTGACAVNNNAWNAFNRESVSPTNWNNAYGYVPRDGDQYHDGRYCLDVIRITDYAKPAANALSFKVYFISPQSQRATHQTFELLRSTEGPWLVKSIGYSH